MCPECAAECAALQRNSELRLLAMEDRLLKQMQEEKQVLIEAFLKHLERGSERQRLGHAKRVTTMTLRRAVKFVVPALLLLLPWPAWALGPVVSKDCVASWAAVTTDAAGAPLLATDGVVSYKVYLSPTASTGGPATPPAGS